MNETVDSLEFVKESLYKFKQEIQKYIADPNNTNNNLINLRNNVEDLEKDISNREKQIVNNISLDKNSTRDFFGNHDNSLNLPDIKTHSTKYLYNTLRFRRKSKISSFYLSENEKISQSNSNFGRIKNPNSSQTFLDPVYYQKDKVYFRQIIEKRNFIKEDELAKQIILRKREFEKNKEKEILLEKYKVNNNSKNSMPRRRSSGMPNYMNKENLIKYSSILRDYNFQAVAYDKTLRPIINESETTKGLLHMINKGIIPRDADLTPAFNKEGNPLSVNKELEMDITYNSPSKKVIEREEIKENFKLNSEDRKDDLFITGANDEYEKSIRSKIKKSTKKQAKTKDIIMNSSNKINQMDNEVSEKSLLRSVTESDDYEVHETSHVLMFSDYKIMKNGSYKNFYNRNLNKWGLISYLINQIQKVLRKFNFSFVQVDANKLEELSLSEVRKISIKDLIFCMTDFELKSRNLDNINPKILLIAIKQASALKIQNNWRNYLSHKKLRELRFINKKIAKIQSQYKQYKINEITKIRLSNKREENKNKFELMMSNFKKNWPEIKSGPRIEIHINSISTPVLKNFTIDKFSEKENNQLTRLISLKDPNVEIIYISPFHLSNEILSYYFSIIQSLGVEDAKERFHLIVPNSKGYFPPGYSLSKLLHYSRDSIARIREYIKDREDTTYIIPGIVSKHDIDLSIYLECPILVGDITNTEALFTKSGAKRVLELTNMAVPISVWDVNSDKDFFNLLVNMIINYPNVNIWIFKMNLEFGGRGIAYIELRRIKELCDLKRDKHVKSISEEKYRQELNGILRKFIAHKVEILANRIYTGWNEYYAEFLKNGGIIEACPTYSLSGIIGSPAIAFLIEPDGHVDTLCTYDKINSFSFRNFGAMSPQLSIPDLVKNIL